MAQNQTKQYAIRFCFCRFLNRKRKLKEHKLAFSAVEYRIGNGNFDGTNYAESIARNVNLHVDILPKPKQFIFVPCETCISVKTIQIPQ